MDKGNLNKLVTNYPVELTPEEVENLSQTLSSVRTAREDDKTYTGEGFVNVNNTNNVISLTNEANEKLNQPIPTKVSDLTDSASYQTVSGMDVYLTKTSASENLAPLSITDDIESLKNASSDWNKVSAKLDTTAFSTVSGNYAFKNDLNDYYQKTETSSKGELDIAFESKQDKLIFGYDENNAISSINNTSLAGQDVTTYSAGQYIEIDKNNTISVTGLLSLDEYSQYEPVLIGDSNITATSSKVDSHTQWNLAINSKPVVTDTKLVGENSITAHTTNVSGEWVVGLEESAHNAIASVAGIATDVGTLKTSSAGWNEVSGISRIDSIESALANKKDKQTELSFDGSSIKTVKKITQDVNGELNVEFENIVYPDYKISSSDVSINVSTSEGVTDLTLPSDVVRDSNYVHIEGATEVPLMDGITSVGLSTKYAREDHIHPTDTSREAIANKTTVILGTSDIKYPTDKAVAEFVNSSIATNTANYISNNGVPFTSVEQLNAYTGTVTNNDYAFVTGIDSQGNTYYDRYKATVNDSSITWALEYRLNNSTFTEAQWTAINSGITSALVAKIHDHSNKDVLDGITSTDVANWNNKIDKQTIGGASEPVYLENGIAKVATNVATKDELATKQNSLIAGDNVTINENTISSNQVFVATYGTTTFQEIKDAYEVGKICICKNVELIGTLYEISNSVIRFQFTKPNQGYIVSYSVSNNNIWTYDELNIQSKLTFDTTPTEGSSNPVTSNGIKKAIDVVNTDIVNLNQSVDDVKTDLNNLTDTVNNHTTQIGGLQTDVESIESTLANKKDKQTELNFNGSATKTIKSITQDVNGVINVEYEDIDLPQEVPNVEITSYDNSVNVVESTDVQTNTKSYDISVSDSVKSKIKDITISNDTLVIIGE